MGWKKKKQYNKTTIADALAQSVTEAWQHLPAETIRNVFGKVPNVLQNIVDDDGRYDLVEGRRRRNKNHYSFYHYLILLLFAFYY